MRKLALAVPLLSLVACAVAPPPSVLPNAQAAIDRMREAEACVHGIHATATIDRFGSGGRLRGQLLLFAVRPALLRLDIVSPFGAALATLTSDGHDFGFSDLRERRIFRGPASACNIARLTSVPIPGPALVDLLRGEAPILKHSPEGATIAWNPHGYYVVTIHGTRDADEEVRLAPRREDWSKPWADQRLHLLDVRVRQRGVELYHVELGDHVASRTASAIVDPDGIDPPLPPSGPACDSDVPRAIHIEVPVRDEDVRIRYDKAEWNPPIPGGVFTQPTSPGFIPEEVECDDGAGGMVPSGR